MIKLWYNDKYDMIIESSSAFIFKNEYGPFIMTTIAPRGMRRWETNEWYYIGDLD
jgi:hypothetical protein